MKKIKDESLPKKRLLPGDFQKFVKSQYESLNQTQKELKKPKGFFTFPEELKGEQDVGAQEFLVFYFRNRDDYKMVLDFFELQTPHNKVHPELKTEKLVTLVKQQNEKNKSKK